MKKHSIIYLPVDYNNGGLEKIIPLESLSSDPEKQGMYYLKPLSDVFIFSEQELLELKKKWMSEAWDDGVIDSQGNYSDAPDKETYINNLNIE